MTSTLVSGNTDIFFNITKRRELIAYSDALPATSAGISYLDGIPVTSSDCVSIKDSSLISGLTDLLPTNTEVGFNRDTTSTFTTYFSVDNILWPPPFSYSPLITDVFSGVNNDPLFFKHIISRQNLPRVGELQANWTEPEGILDYNNLLIVSGITLNSAKLLNSNLSPVATGDVYLDLARGILYSNTQNQYISPSNYTTYYVQYTITNGTSQTTYTDILNSVPVYRKAEPGEWGTAAVSGYKLYDYVTTISDVTPTYGALQQFTVDIENAYYMRVPKANTYAVKQYSKQPLEVMPPVNQKINDAWYLRISNGGLLYQKSGSYAFRIKEWPGIIQRRMFNDNATIIDANTIKLSAPNVAYLDNYSQFINGAQSVILLDINNSTGKSIAAITNSPFIIGNISSNGQPYQPGITGVDFINSLLDINVSGLQLDPTWEVIANYYWWDYDFTYSGIDFNPLHNPNLINNNIYLCIDPVGGPTFVATKPAGAYPPPPSSGYCPQSIFYIETDNSNHVIASDYPAISGVAFNPVQPGYWNWYGNGTRTVLYYPTKPSWDVLASGVASVVFDPDSAYKVAQANPYYSSFSVLAKVTVNTPVNQSDYDIYECRRRGGGIKTSLFDQAVTINPDVNWYWDKGMWDGEPFPGQGAFIAEIPADILADGGGIFTHQQVRDVVNRHACAGIYSCVRGYGVDISISGVQSTTSGMLVKWTGAGITESISYNVYLTSNPTDQWTLLVSGLIDNGGVNTYTVTGLSNSSNYYLSILGGYNTPNGFIPLTDQTIGMTNAGIVGPGDPTIPYIQFQYQTV